MNKKLALLCLSMLVSAGMSFADPVPAGDPRMISGDGSGSLNVTSFDFTFEFVIPASGNATSITLRNAILLPGEGGDGEESEGATLRTLIVTPPGGAYTTGEVGNSCGFYAVNTYFTFCSAPSGDNGSWVFSGARGVRPGEEFSFTVFGFNPGDYEFRLVSETTPVPEPASIALLAPGVLAFAGIARRRFLHA